MADDELVQAQKWQLRPEQAARLSVVPDEWLAVGLATGPADRQAAERGVAKAYRAAGLKPPRLVVWLDSPFAGVIGAWALSRLAQVGYQVWAQIEMQVREQIRAQIGKQVWAQVELQVGTQVRDQVWGQVGNQIWEQVQVQIGPQFRDQVWAQVGSRVRAQIESQIEAQIGSRVGLRIWDQLWDRVGHQLAEGRVIYGQHGAGGLAVYDVFRRARGRLAAHDGLTALMTVARAAGWWWPFRDAVVLTERPTELHRDDRHRLHCATGPAVRYPDGFAVHAWHGVLVDERIVTGELTGADWLAERNTEVRRMIAERLGCQRLLDQVQAEKRHTDEFGTLWRIPAPAGDDEDIWLVDVANATPEPDGSFKRYVLRVPPDLPTAHAAVAWTFGLAPEDYQPTAQT